MRKVNLLSALCWYILYWLYQLPLLRCQITLVERNDIDSFRIGDGCNSSRIVCPKYKAHCYENKCLCESASPHFRNPIVERSQDKSSFQYGSSYGCITDEELKEQRPDKLACSFIPRDQSLLPHGPTTMPKSITYYGDRNYIHCNLVIRVEVKYPDSNDWFNLPWLNNSYFDFSLQKMEFKWTKFVGDLQGSIIMIFLNCGDNVTATQECLQAKVEGTWTVNSSRTTSLPTTTSLSSPLSVPEVSTSQIPSNITDSSSPTTITTNATNNAMTENDENSISLGALAAAIIIPVIFLIVGVIIIVWFIKRKKRQRDIKEPVVFTNKFDEQKESHYARPSVQRVEVNGDPYAVVIKPKKETEQLNYMDPGRLDLEDISNENRETSQPTEYATISGVLNETL